LGALRGDQRAPIILATMTMLGAKTAIVSDLLLLRLSGRDGIPKGQSKASRKGMCIQSGYGVVF